MSFDMVAPMPPDCQRPAFFGVPMRQCACAAPECQKGALDPVADGAISNIVVMVERRCCSVLLAYCMDTFAITQHRLVAPPYLLRKNRGRGSPARKHALNYGVWRSPQQFFRQWSGLGKQAPRPEAQRKTRISAIPRVSRRNHVEHGKLLNDCGMIEGHSVRNSSTAVVPSDHEAVMPKPLHQPNHIICHRTFCVWSVIRFRGRSAALAISAQISADDRKFL